MTLQEQLAELLGDEGYYIISFCNRCGFINPTAMIEHSPHCNYEAAIRRTLKSIPELLDIAEKRLRDAGWWWEIRYAANTKCWKCEWREYPCSAILAGGFSRLDEHDARMKAAIAALTMLKEEKDE